MSECISTVGPFPCISILKPWGGYTDIFRSDEVVFKKIVISPGEEISYQRHYKRSEFWYVAEGKGIFRWNNVKDWKVEPGFTVEIRKNDSHQVTNTGESDLVIFEMQFGECSEDDIKRLEDKYDR
jgi:mannose-6-phosphate isomerase